MTSSIFIDWWWLLEINAINCRHGAIIYANCRFHIRINPPINDQLHCELRFVGSNNSNVELINKQISLIGGGHGENCSSFSMIINAENKDEKVIDDIHWLLLLLL